MEQNQKLEFEPFFTEGEIEIRSGEGGKQYFYGYAALYNVRSRTLTTKSGKKFVEVILPGAFDKTDFSDQRSHFDHSEFLAAEPTLKFGTDQRGLWYQIEYDDDDPAHRSAMRRVKRGDAKGSSFQFMPLSADCYDLTTDGDVPLRSIKRIPRVLEMGPVITPAYSQTTAFARSLDELSEEPELPNEQQLLLEQRKLEAMKFIGFNGF